MIPSALAPGSQAINHWYTAWCEMLSKAAQISSLATLAVLPTEPLDEGHRALRRRDPVQDLHSWPTGELVLSIRRRLIPKPRHDDLRKKSAECGHQAYRAQV